MTKFQRQCYSTTYYYPLYKGWVFHNTPIFTEPFFALCWQYWNIYRDGLIHYWKDTYFEPKWHKCVGVIKIKNVSTLEPFTKKESMWKEVLNLFFSKINIFQYSIGNSGHTSDIIIATSVCLRHCRDYFKIPDYQGSINSTIKTGSVCSLKIKSAKCGWSTLDNRKGIPSTLNHFGLIDIGYTVKQYLQCKEYQRSPSEFILYIYIICPYFISLCIKT